MGKILKSSGGNRGKFNGGKVPKANMKAGLDQFSKVINPNTLNPNKGAPAETKPDPAAAKDGPAEKK